MLANGAIASEAAPAHASRRALGIDREILASAPAPMHSEPMSAALVEHPLTAPTTASQPPSSTTAMPQAAAQAAPPVDMDEWIDKACAEMMQRLSIEQERRGLTAWT